MFVLFGSVRAAFCIAYRVSSWHFWLWGRRGFVQKGQLGVQRSTGRRGVSGLSHFSERLALSRLMYITAKTIYEGWESGKEGSEWLGGPWE
jgi:hypothetical protein